MCQQLLSLNDDLLEKRIIGGQRPPAEAHTYALSLRGDDPDKKSSMFCGATLISPLWIITAAHCFLGHSHSGIPFNNPALWTVQVGSKKIDWLNDSGPVLRTRNANPKIADQNKTKPARKLHLDQVIQHPNYQEHDIEWDIALAKLTQPIYWLTPVNLPYHHKYQQVTKKRSNVRNKGYAVEEPKVGTVCEMIGWGCRYMGGPAVELASMAKLQIVSHDQCNEWYRNGAGLSRINEFCAGFYKKNIGVCPGDSGSGLFCQSQGKWYIEGVTSATHREFPESYPGIFSRVTFYLKWIEHILQHK
ncbi:hypothetical protein Ciccas_008592 [Cichlidogyrus casuarinus]|uniref:Peptidase S1 domain-containing protein n=1 Tax=Cichlidogyrus casuarinus TaxID=1844966 RepID=A0ABD2PZJ6_9PLAT